MIKDLLEYIVKNLVEQTDQVSVAATMQDDTQVFAITVDSADRGKVIGREGQTIKALRILAGALVPEGVRVVVDVAPQQ
jgi:uncharacterized protein